MALEDKCIVVTEDGQTKEIGDLVEARQQVQRIYASYQRSHPPITPHNDEDYRRIDEGFTALASGRIKQGTLLLGPVTQTYKQVGTIYSLYLRSIVYRTYEEVDAAYRVTSLSYRWITSGLSQIVMGHKLAAALMATKTNKDAIEMVRPPWRGFVINLPNGLLKCPGVDVEVRYLSVGVDNNNLWSIGFGNDDTLGSSVGSYNISLSALLEEDFIDELVVEKDDRIPFQLAGRLVVGTCLLMADPQYVTPPRGMRRTSGAKAPIALSPATYKIGAPVLIDCRKEIVAAQQGAGSSAPPTVRFIVRGHWKAQPHGPGRTFRKTMWIQPYWKGEEGMPVLVRPHVIKKDAPTEV